MYAFGLLGAFTPDLGGAGPHPLAGTQAGRSSFCLGLLTSVLVVGAWCGEPGAQDGGHPLRRLGHAAGPRRWPTPSAGAGWAARRRAIVTAEAAERAAAQLPGRAGDPDRRGGAGHAGGVPVEHAGGHARAQPAPVPGGGGPRARLRRAGGLPACSSTRSPGCSFRPRPAPRARPRRCWPAGVDYFRQADIVAIPIWRMAHDAGASIAGAARRLGVGAVLVGTSQRSAVWHLLRGNVLQVAGGRAAQGHPGLDLQLMRGWGAT